MTNYFPPRTGLRRAEGCLEMSDLGLHFVTTRHGLKYLAFEQDAIVVEKALVGLAQGGFARAQSRCKAGGIFTAQASAGL